MLVCVARYKFTYVCMYSGFTECFCSAVKQGADEVWATTMDQHHCAWIFWLSSIMGTAWAWIQWQWWQSVHHRTVAWWSVLVVHSYRNKRHAGVTDLLSAYFLPLVTLMLWQLQNILRKQWATFSESATSTNATHVASVCIKSDTVMIFALVPRLPWY